MTFKGTSSFSYLFNTLLITYIPHRGGFRLLLKGVANWQANQPDFILAKLNTYLLDPGYKTSPKDIGTKSKTFSSQFFFY